MGTVDKGFRIFIAMLILGAFYTDSITGTTAIVLLLIGGVLVLTSFMSFCPLYYPFGLTTIKKK